MITVIKDITRNLYGKANWIYDHELGCYIPCCSHPKMKDGKPQLCGNGPLEDSEIMMGLCSDGPHMTSLPRRST